MVLQSRLLGFYFSTGVHYIKLHFTISIIIYTEHIDIKYIFQFVFCQFLSAWLSPVKSCFQMNSEQYLLPWSQLVSHV